MLAGGSWLAGYLLLLERELDATSLVVAVALWWLLGLHAKIVAICITSDQKTLQNHSVAGLAGIAKQLLASYWLLGQEASFMPLVIAVALWLVTASITYENHCHMHCIWLATEPLSDIAMGRVFTYWTARKLVPHWLLLLCGWCWLPGWYLLARIIGCHTQSLYLLTSQP